MVLGLQTCGWGKKYSTSNKGGVNTTLSTDRKN
jgi:hypothetical protein